MVFAYSHFMHPIFAALILAPIILLWIAALVDVLRSHQGGLHLAAILVLILIVPVIGPLLYFIFRKPTMSDEDLAARQMAQADMAREAARHAGGTGLH